MPLLVRSWGLLTLGALAWLAGCGGDPNRDAIPIPNPPPHGGGKADGPGPEHLSSDYSILRAGNRYAAAVGDPYVDDVQPRLAARCAVCHSCTNGPCQLNMTSFAALERGVSNVNPYDFGLFEKSVTRVSDERPLSYWRAQGFRSVLPRPGVAPHDSVFFKALALGEGNLAGATQKDGPLALSTTRRLAEAHHAGDAVCPATADEYEDLVAEYPQGGMPWGLPVDGDAQSVLEAWVLDGAVGPSEAARQALRAPQPTPFSQGDPRAVVASWEAFLGGDRPREQLVARYLYEHASLANIQLSESPGEFYRVVRSKTPAPAPIDPIFADLPHEAPSGYTGRVYYRLRKIDRLIEGKTHVPWELSLAHLEHLKALFLGGGWDVARLPGYTLNPFETFAAIPEAIRSRFMMENARMLYGQLASGPICLVQLATYAVDEYFWILFVKPESDPTVRVPKLGLRDYATFFTKDGNLTSGVPILGNKYGEPTYREAFEKTLRKLKPGGLGVEDIWTGDGWNENAWLTVHRHQFTVEVETTLDRPTTGLPKSVWLITYANFERMFYNAVDQYKYWGSLKHQNDTFNWQIYTRSEAEDLWASLFPDQAYREALRDRFTNLEGKVYNQLFTDYAEGRPSASPQIKTEDQMGRALLTAMAPVLGPRDRLNGWPDADLPRGIAPAIRTPEEFETGLRALTNRAAPFAGFLPNVVHVRLGGDRLYTLMVVRGFSNNKMGPGESRARRREEDRMVAIPGFAGFTAHMFVDLPYERAAQFLTELDAVRDEAGWLRFDAAYKVARNSDEFWGFVDWLHAWMGRNIPLRAALLELRTYDMTATPF